LIHTNVRFGCFRPIADIQISRLRKLLGGPNRPLLDLAALLTIDFAVTDGHPDGLCRRRHA